MTVEIGFLAFIAFISWGVSGLFDKMGATSLGNRGVWAWIASYVPALIFWAIAYLMSDQFGFAKSGIIFLFLSTFTALLAGTAYYLLMLKADASFVIPLTSLYPIFTVFLAVIVLHETLTVTRIVGIGLALSAIFFLSL